MGGTVNEITGFCQMEQHIINDWPQFSTAVRRELHKNRRAFPKLAAKANVSVRWVRSFSAGEYPSTRPDWVLALAEALGLKPMLSIANPEEEFARKPVEPVRGGAGINKLGKTRGIAGVLHKARSKAR